MTFSDSENRYSVTEFKLEASKWGIKIFHSFSTASSHCALRSFTSNVFPLNEDHRVVCLIPWKSCWNLILLSNTALGIRIKCLIGCPTESFMSDDYSRSPMRMSIYSEITVDSLVIHLSLLQEESGNNLNFFLRVGKLQDQLVNKLLKDWTRLGFTLTKVSSNHIRAMWYPVGAPALKLLLSASTVTIFCQGLDTFWDD